MNNYLKNLTKIEFVVTLACTGRCKHCSEGDHARCGERIDPNVAADTVRAVAGEYPIRTVMAFGGEPLLYPEAVYAIMDAAREMDVPKRQLITNGFFTKDGAKIRTVAENLSRCGVNDLLLSADAFHQETIPLESVMQFAEEALAFGIPIRLQPAWLVSADHDNPYNRKTREILRSFRHLGIGINEGNVIFPEGNALRYLGEYFTENLPPNPYTEDPCDVKCLSVSPNGDVLGGNLYDQPILTIIKNYTP